MTSLFVDRRGVELKLDGEALVFAENGERVGTVPLMPLSRVFLRGDVKPSPVRVGYTIPRNLFAKRDDYGFPALNTSGLVNQIGAVFDDRPVPGVRVAFVASDGGVLSAVEPLRPKLMPLLLVRERSVLLSKLALSLTRILTAWPGCTACRSCSNTSTSSHSRDRSAISYNACPASKR